MSQPANCQLPICNRAQLAVGKLTSELIEIPQQSGATNGGSTCRLMQLPKFVFVLMKFFPLHKTHSNLTIDDCPSPPLSLLSTHSFWANYSEPELCRQIYGNIIGRRQQRGEWGGEQWLRKGTKFMRQAMPLNSPMKTKATMKCILRLQAGVQRWKGREWQGRAWRQEERGREGGGFVASAPG